MVAYCLVRLLDWFDRHILGHRFYRICTWIAGHPWWNRGYIDQRPFEVLHRLDWVLFSPANTHHMPLLVCHMPRVLTATGEVKQEAHNIVITVGEMKAMLQALPDELDRSHAVQEGFRQAWHEAQTGQTRPISELWDELKADQE